MTMSTDKATLLAVVRASMKMLVNAISQGEPTAHGLSIDEAIEVNPFSTIHRPGLPAESLTNSTRQNRLL